MLLLIDNYDSFTWNIYHYLAIFKYDVEVVRNDKFDIRIALSKKYKGIILSPGPGHPKKTGNVIELIKSNNFNIPMLGICLGHQALAYSYGATISKMKNVMHGRKDKIIKKKNIPLFKNIPKEFLATRYHSLEIKKLKLPKKIEIIAATLNGCIMGLKIKGKNSFGLQFHPESIATEYGEIIFENFINICYRKEN